MKSGNLEIWECGNLHVNIAISESGIVCVCVCVCESRRLLIPIRGDVVDLRNVACLLKNRVERVQHTIAAITAPSCVSEVIRAILAKTVDQICDFYTVAGLAARALLLGLDVGANLHIGRVNFAEVKTLSSPDNATLGAGWPIHIQYIADHRAASN